MNAPEPVLPVSGPTVGRRLAAAREQRGLDQAAAARLSGLSAEVVRGLEAEDWAALGAPVYVRGWLARYCRVLDVEASSALAEYRQAVPAEPPPLRLRGEAPSSAPRGHHSLRPFAYLLSFALLGYVGWQAFEKLSTDLTVSGNAGLAQPTGVARAPGGLTRSESARPAPVTASAPETTPAPAPAVAPAAVNPVAATPGHAAAPAPSMNPVAPATASPALAAAQPHARA
ncbi:MAG TPA: helix-turn-helix domain-containing protein, partial [Plasticicumulans sp.]|uniref:helix-turn-helix domain-containing protein n=2 Tax=Plasticicumulans sp. TaxID=2307179 RepID=UPI002C3647C9